MRTLLFVSAFQISNFSAFASETYPATNGLERSLVAQQPLLKNPVSVSVDVDGIIYVTETARRKIADLDIREYSNHGWIEKDVALTSVEDKLAFLRKELDGTNQFPKSSLKDLNKDGKIDFNDLREVSEKVVRLIDNDGDGVMDESNIFAEDFNTEVTGIAAGTLAWRGDVYATIAPDVWKLRDTNGDGKADKREAIAHGFGIHIAYAGHDMHGLTLGPDGRLYWSIGDKGTNVTDNNGKNHYAPHEGAVLRCYPDGSGFEIFARGLRNPQEIAFDKYGNLFSVDNDSDQKGERERFLHITEASDTGWRNYYQYRGSSYNPWMAENIWEPSGKFQPAYITPTNQNYSDGPSGFAYNPGTALNSKYENAFFVTEFPKGNLRSFKVKAKGATFEMTDEHTVYSGPMNVGINFGPDGALYSADWSGGYPLNEKGAIWKLDDPKIAGSEIRKEVADMLKAGPSKSPTADLVKRLSHPDMRIRLDAQWELAGRNAKDELIATAASDTSDQMAVIHSLWGLAQMNEFDSDLFKILSENKDAELRAQALRYATETRRPLIPNINKLLTDESSRVRYFAAMFLWKAEMGKSSGIPDTLIDQVTTMLAENDNQDAYLRHAGVMALTTVDPWVLGTKVAAHKSPSVRLAAAVALRRISSPLSAKLLEDSDSKVVTEAARAIYDDPPIISAFPALADLIRVNPNATPPAIRRSISANRYLADAASAARLAKFAASEEAPTDLRVAALEALASWTQASELNPVDGRYDPLKTADVTIARAAYQSVATSLQNSPEIKIAEAATAASKNLGIASNPEEIRKKLFDPKAKPADRLQALDSLEASDPSSFEKILPELLNDTAAPLRIRAATLLADKDPAAATSYAEKAIIQSGLIWEKQQAILLLGKLKPEALKPLLVDPSSEPSLAVELAEALPDEKIDISPQLLSLTGGSADLGEKVFNEHLAAQCTACHRIGNEGSDVGPPLTEVGKKGRAYILESLIDPQKAISPGYGMMAIKTTNGISISGSLLEENDKTLTLLLPDKTKETINLEHIQTRTDPLSTMPPMGNILSPRELRDLVQFLAEQQ